jgi:hypothetical protein
VQIVETKKGHKEDMEGVHGEIVQRVSDRLLLGLAHARERLGDGKPWWSLQEHVELD